MTLIASAIIEGARDSHPMFDARQTPPRPALRRLSYACRQVVQRIAEIYPELLEVEVELLPAPDPFDPDVAIVLAKALHREGRTAEFDIGTAEFSFVDAKDEVTTDLWPSGFISGDDLFLIGDAVEWEKCTKITYAHVLIPAELDALTDTLAVPDEAEEYLVADLALFMARRASGRPGAPAIGAFTSERNEALSEFRYAIANMKTGIVHSIRSID